MPDITQETIRQLSGLCRIHCTVEEEQSLMQDLKRVIGYIEQLNEIDTEGVPPCSHVIADMRNVMREDEVGETLSRKTFLDNAPEHVGGMIRVPPVL